MLSSALGGSRPDDALDLWHPGANLTAVSAPHRDLALDRAGDYRGMVQGRRVCRVHVVGAPGREPFSP